MIRVGKDALGLAGKSAALAALLIVAACGGDGSDTTPDAQISSAADAAQVVDAAANPDADTTPDATPADARPPDATPVDANTDPTIASVDYPVIAHGGQLVLTGINLTGATAVTIGGVSHTNLTAITDTSVTVMAVEDAVPVGLATAVTVTTPVKTSPPLNVTVIHLTINEVESDSPGADNHEFVELDIGLAASVSLDGYVLIFFNGADSGDPSIPGRVYDRVDLAGTAATTATNGLMVIGETGISTTPQILFNGSIQQGEDALAIYQFTGAVSSFPGDYTTAGNTGLIDAVIHISNADAPVAALTPLLTDGVRIDEGTTSAARETVSIQRCPGDTTRRKGASYRLEIPTPGMANVNCGGAATALADCTIDFSSSCPNTNPGTCGAIFVAHGAGAQCHTIGVPACYGTGTSFHTLAADERLDIFLTGNLNSLSSFLAPYQGTDATMEFFTLDGTKVGSPYTVTTDCAVGVPPAVSPADVGAGAVRRIQVSGTADVWVDDFHVNP